MPSPVRAVVWDFDNTLVDSRARNLAVTRRIAARLFGSWEPFPMLCSQQAYDLGIAATQNWRDLYRIEFSMDEELIDEAGRLWTDYQLEETTESPFLPGIPDALRALRHLPRGIVSANSRHNIESTLGENGWAKYFDVVIGYEEVHLRSQKPEPDGLLLCLERLAVLEAGVVVYVGDHEADAECAANTNLELERRGEAVRVISVGADYGRSEGPDWSFEPQHRARAPRDVIEIVSGLEGGAAGA
jgi:HAD superfamily hydrolase (TIGR01549 family)